MIKVIAKFIAAIAKKTAISACGAASNWNAYQPKEPDIMKKFAH